jgi:competence protein ComFC
LKCPICHQKIKKGEFICTECLERIKYHPIFTCKKCKKKLNGDYGKCTDCKNTVFYYDELTILGYYEHLMGEFVKRIKFKQERKLAIALGKKLGEKIKEKKWEYDYIIPIPMSADRFHERGFNQAYEIAKGVNKILGSTVKNNLIKKKNLPPLEQKNRKERIKLMKNSFIANKKSVILKNKNILIIDDVYTTGTTVNTLAGLIKKIGANKIYVGVLAR